MTQQGWQEGQSLGNRESIHVGANDADRLAAARVGILFKDNNLGLGAKTKSQDVEGQRTGLDAFQGLLGRLNGKSDAELKKQEKKIEDRKLEMYARGRWGGLVFVKGGILEGSIEDKATKTNIQDESGSQTDQLQSEPVSDQDEGNEKRRRKEEKRQRKEERRKRREEKALRKATKKAKTREAVTTSLPLHKSPLSQPPDEPVSSSSSENENDATVTSKKAKRRRSSTAREELANSKSPTVETRTIKSGRHVLRGRNIQAKRMAFSNMKGLDEIFMRPG